MSVNSAASFHDDGLVVLNTGNGRVFRSNLTGARIWRGIEQRLPVEAIAAEMSRDYQIEPRVAAEHALRFITELARNGLVEQSSWL